MITTPMTRSVLGIRDADATQTSTTPKTIRTAATTYSAAGVCNDCPNSSSSDGAATPTRPITQISAPMMVATTFRTFICAVRPGTWTRGDEEDSVMCQVH